MGGGRAGREKKPSLKGGWDNITEKPRTDDRNGEERGGKKANKKRKKKSQQTERNHAEGGAGHRGTREKKRGEKEIVYVKKKSRNTRCIGLWREVKK